MTEGAAEVGLGRVVSRIHPALPDYLTSCAGFCEWFTGQIATSDDYPRYSIGLQRRTMSAMLGHAVVPTPGTTLTVFSGRWMSTGIPAGSARKPLPGPTASGRQHRSRPDLP